jgi:hypothetical protein
VLEIQRGELGSHFCACSEYSSNKVIRFKVLWSPPWLGWQLWNVCVRNDHGYVPLVVNTCRSFPHSWLITGFVTRLTQWVPLVEQKLSTLLEHLSSPPVFSGVRVTQSLDLCVCFVDHCLSFCNFSFGHCVVCPSIYGFWLPLWYLQTLFNLNWKFFKKHTCLSRTARHGILLWGIWPFLYVH